MEINKEVLNYIFSNAEMGELSIDYILEVCHDKKFCNLLKMQKEEYSYIKHEAKTMLEKNNCSYKKASIFTKFMLKSSINMKINEESKISNIVIMLIKGTNRGIIAITDKLNNYKITDKKVKKLAKTLKTTLENNLEELKKYI